MAAKKRNTRRTDHNRRFTERKLNSSMRKKLVWSFGLIVLALVGLAIRITYINATEGQKYKQVVLAQSQRQYDSKVIPFKRGDILDTNGTILATSEKVYNVILDCKVVNSDEDYVDATVEALVEILGFDEEEIRNKLTNEETKSSQYQVLKKGMSITDKKNFEEYCSPENIEELSDDELEKRNLVKGVWFEEDYVRTYPMNSLACDVIGFTYTGNTADWGIEGYYSESLNGVNGRQYGYFNSDADVEQTIIEAQDGNSVISTLDVNIQEIVENKISELMEGLSGGPNGDEGAENVGVVVMDPNTGNILAMAGNDPYDLNNPRDLSDYYTQEEITNMSDDDTLEALNAIWKNYCISDTFEPGSTVKPMTVAAGLMTNSIQYTEEFDCDGYENIADRMIKCSIYPDAHGNQTIGESLKNSCNDAMMQIAEKIGVDTFVDYQTNVFNFGSKTGIDLPGEAAGITYTSSSMGQAELATCSFGQGFTCTMIQEAAAVSSVINGGYYYQPHIVKQILNPNGSVIKNIEPVLMRQTVSEEVSERIRGYMGEVVESDGTGRYGKVDGYSMGGKTGTAQKLPRGNGKYLISFVGFAPLDDPQILIYAVVDEPNVEQQSVSAYAQYLVHEITEEILPYLNIFPDEETTGINDELTIDEIFSINEEPEHEGLADTEVPDPPEDEEEVTGGNDMNEDGVTNEDAGIE